MRPKHGIIKACTAYHQYTTYMRRTRKISYDTQPTDDGFPVFSPFFFSCMYAVSLFAAFLPWDRYIECAVSYFSECTLRTSYTQTNNLIDLIDKKFRMDRRSSDRTIRTQYTFKRINEKKNGCIRLGRCIASQGGSGTLFLSPSSS